MMAADRRQRGFSLVPALFLIIVLAGLGVVAVRMSVVESQTVVLAMQGARAHSAALSGIEWAAYEAISNGNCAATTLDLAEGGLAGFTVDISCSSVTRDEKQATITVYYLEAFARSGVYGSPDYVSRRLRTTVVNAS